MLISTTPIFDSNMAVKGYLLNVQKINQLVDVQTAKRNDGATSPLALKAISELGIEAISGSYPVFFKISNIALLVDLNSQCDAPPEQIVFMIDSSVEPIEMYLNRISLFKEYGYSFALHGVASFPKHAELLKYMDYAFLDQKFTNVEQSKVYLRANFKNLKVVANNIKDKERYDHIKHLGFDCFEGDFYRLPITKGIKQVTPLKINYIQLVNIANDENFDISEVATIVQQDTALALSLLKMVNKLGLASEIKTIKQAAALLGQSELRKWITTAVVGQLYADKPNELTRLSLIRAKFAENLAGSFELAILSKELFLMGLFSLVDIILDMPMSEAANVIKLSEPIKKALIHNKGNYAPVLHFIRCYESANWYEVNRLLILNNMPTDKLTKAYIDTLKWYSSVTSS